MKPDAPSIRVRPAVAADAADMLRLIDGLAEYEKLEPPDAAARERLVRDAFAPTPLFQVYLAELEMSDGTTTSIGYAFVVDKYSSFLALPSLYLEDIFVLPEYRGLRAGYALFRHVVRVASDRGCGRVEFVVLDWNKPAQEFYHRLGAGPLKEWVNYRLVKEDFAAILEA
jgi:GNAT superfamily N-acetyltransferase